MLKTNQFSSDPPEISGFLPEVHSYGFNGQEKESQITGAETHTSAEFWMYDARIGRRWNIDPRPSLSISPYNCFYGNPIFFCDPFGDTIAIGNAESDAAGMSALEHFVSTKEGYDAVAKYAVKGQTIGNVTFKENGILSDQIDLKITFDGVTKKQGADTDTYRDNDKDGGGAEISIRIFKDKGWQSSNETWNKLISISHEIFIHAESGASDYLDDCTLNYSNLPKEVVRTMGLDIRHFDHVAVRDAALGAQVDQKSFLKSKYPWPGKAFATLTTVSAKEKWGFTEKEIISQMWDYNGGLTIDPKTGIYNQ